MARFIFTQELSLLQERLLHPGTQVEQSVAHALTALEKQDRALRGRVIEADDAIDSRRTAIEQHMFRLLTRQRPCGSGCRRRPRSLSESWNARGIALLSSSYPHRTTYATEDIGMNDQKAQGIERGMLRLAEGPTEKDCSHTISLAAYSTRKTAWGLGVRPKSLRG